MSQTERKIIDKVDEEQQVYARQQAMLFTTELQNALLQRNPKRAVSRSYTQYTKESIRTYLQNPSTSIDNIREISRFLERNSMLYKKMLLYYATLPLFSYNLVQLNDWSKSVNAQKQTKSFLEVAKQLNGFNQKVNMFTLTYTAIRDGLSVGFSYSDDDSTYFQLLDPQYCRIFGKNEDGQWVVYFNAAYFGGNNSIFVTGIDGDETGVWDQVFIDGYNEYQKDRNAQWFMLPPERTCCLLSVSDDLADVPLPFFAPMFLSLIDLSDFEQIMADKTELENYKILVNKIPMISNSDRVNDFAIQMELAEKFDAQYDGVLPDLVGHVLSPGFDMDVVSFERSNTAQDSNTLANSIENIFNQSGISQIVVAGGKSTNSVGLAHAIKNDMAVAFDMWVIRIESWMNYFIKANLGADGYHFYYHRESWYNRDEYITEKKDAVTLGASVLDWLTAMDKTPYIAYQEIQMDNMLGLKDIMRPLSSSYTQSSNEGGAPTKDDDDLSESGVATRDGDKNAGTKANS